MSSPLKSPMKDRFTELSAADTRLILYASICFNGTKLDTEKLARLADMKPGSAGSNYWRAKRRLEKILGEERPGSSVSPTKTKSRAPASRKAARKAPEVPQAENTDEAEAKDDSAETLLTTRAPKRCKTVTPADGYFEAEVSIVKDEPTDD
ncbi:hypothetical protein PENARI_c001G03260 [Penicillium arizonense]|uniref:Uncharacterized protein n=1 Tax=Penicillium arizonense TaxID=1835702 RepID=A0A1F5LYR7_PENAI|nr:hypothetical protein PENARI_c001G03260 [Penicillium arizonense]OGE58317.1 hypothetical protein PENARI_c001G03260 [Penicillium arizonense]